MYAIRSYYDFKGEAKADILALLERVPTIGANGTLVRRALVADTVGDYFFDIDEIYGLMLRGHDT